MHNPHIELDIDGPKIEYAYGLAQQMQMRDRQDFGARGWKYAKQRHPGMLLAMEKAAEYVTQLGEAQRGETIRAAKMSGGNYGDSAEFTEVAMWREAYRLMDEGRPIRNFEWIYGAGAWLAGLIPT